MADTVADTKETITVGTPEKEDVEKKVDVVDEDSKALGNIKPTPKDKVPKPKENGTGEEKDSAEDSQDKEDESAEGGDSTDSVPERGTKRIRNVPENTPVEEKTPVEGASPEKKAKLEEKPAEAEANATNGEPEAVA